MVGYTEAIANLLPLIARAAYAASRISSNLKQALPRLSAFEGRVAKLAQFID